MNFLIDSPVLHKLKPAFAELLVHLKKAIAEKQPIYVRHHADADGYTAGIALERALVPLISVQHRRERDVSLYYQRLPTMTPYYSYEDATRDVQNFQRMAEQFGTKAPFFLLLDFGSGSESLQAIQKIKIYGASVAIIDHHPPDSHITQAAVVHINPHLVGSTYDYSAGMLAAEIAHLLLADVKGFPDQHLSFIAAVSGTADKVASEEHKKYCALSSHHGFSKDFVQRVAAAVDYEAHVLGFSPGKEIMQDILGRDAKKQEKLLVVIEKELHRLFREQLASCLQYATVSQKKHFVFVTVPIETVQSSRNPYPPRGKAIGLVLQHFAAQGKKALVVGAGNTSFNFRCSTEIKNFDVNDLIHQCKKKFPYAQISGGGHRVAGTLTFISAAYQEILEFLEQYVDGLEK